MSLQKYLKYILQIAQHCAIMKHVQTCSNILIRIDTILQTCLDMFKYYDTIWYELSKLVYDIYNLIRFYKHVQTCSNIMIRFNMILQTCPNLSMISWYNLIQFYMSQTCLDLFKTIRWRNTLKIERIGKNSWRQLQSYSLDRERSVARDQKQKKVLYIKYHMGSQLLNKPVK